MIFLRPVNYFQLSVQQIINIFFRLWVSIKKKMNISNVNSLFLSGDFFKALAKNKKNSKIVFSTLKNFPKKKDFNKFKKKIWIFHNSDDCFDLRIKKKLEFFKPIKCFSQNLIFNSKKYCFLPIGLENNKFHNHGETKDFSRLRKKKITKKPKILFGFKITNKKRIILKNKLRTIPICDETVGWNSYFYRRILLKYMFVVCPEGNGIDTHRLWEALYLRTIPIIEKNKISNFFLKANLPVLILNKWSDLSKFKEKDLAKIYFSRRKLFKNNYLFQNYWKKIIN